MRTILITGKPGVGKTSHAVATALACAERGQRVFLLSVDPTRGLSDVVGARIGPAASKLAPRLFAQEASPESEREHGWQGLREPFHALLRDDADGVLTEELLGFSAVEELAALRGVCEIERAGEIDVCVVDCAPTLETVQLTGFPGALRTVMKKLFSFDRRGTQLLPRCLHRVGRAAGVASGFDEAWARLERDVAAVRRLLLDRERTSARLVTRPTRVAAEAFRRTFSYLSLAGVATDAVIVNRVLPAAAADGYFSTWAARGQAELAGIRASFPGPVFTANLQHRALRGLPALRELAREVYGENDPAGCLMRERSLRFVRRGGRPLLEVALPGIPKEEISIESHGRELQLRVREAERWVTLPDSLSGATVERIRVEAGILEVEFGKLGGCGAFST